MWIQHPHTKGPYNSEQSGTSQIKPAAVVNFSRFPTWRCIVRVKWNPVNTPPSNHCQMSEPPFKSGAQPRRSSTNVDSAVPRPFSRKFFPGEYGEVLGSWKGLEAVSAGSTAGFLDGADRTGECGKLSPPPNANERAKIKTKCGADEEKVVE